MGCAGSRFDEMPVTGSPGGLKVLPGSEKFIFQEPTILKLREKFFCFSGDDCSVKDMDGRLWFRIEGSSMSLSSKRSMTDADGQQVAGYQKKLLSMHATAYITVQEGGRTMVVATIKKQSAFQLESSADVYIHNPPVNIDEITTDGLVPMIHVEGDIISKKYDFMMGDLQTNPYKIAQVVRKFKMVMENNSYFLHMGTNVDVAFITMCAFAIDELFSDDK